MRTFHARGEPTASNAKEDRKMRNKDKGFKNIAICDSGNTGQDPGCTACSLDQGCADNGVTSAAPGGRPKP